MQLGLVGRRWINELFLRGSTICLLIWHCRHAPRQRQYILASACTSEIELKSLTSEANCEGCDENQVEEEARNKYSLLQPRLLPLAFCASVFVAVISSSRALLASKRSDTNDGAPHRPTFVRFYSPGHCGTRFLTEIFMTNDIISTTNSPGGFRNHQNQTSHLHYTPSLYWNEDNLYLMHVHVSV